MKGKVNQKMSQTSMNRNTTIIIILGLLIILAGMWFQSKYDQHVKVNKCLDKGGHWDYETQKCGFTSLEEKAELQRTDTSNEYIPPSKQSQQIFTISEYNTDLEGENIERPARTIIMNPTIDTTLLFKIWTLDPNGPHADFWFNGNEFYVVDYDGDGAMPYLLNQNSLTIYYNDLIRKGIIVSVGKDTLKIHWNESEVATEYVEWKN